MRLIIRRKNQSKFIRFTEMDIICYCARRQRIAVYACQGSLFTSRINYYVDTGSSAGVIDSDSDSMYASAPNTLHET